ncbi:MAG: hypothetical protein ACRD1K_21380 [Acidimicrobiales bacterium]
MDPGEPGRPGRARQPPRLDADTAALLDQAEDIVNAVGAEAQSEVKRTKVIERTPQPFWKKLFRRR